METDIVYKNIRNFCLEQMSKYEISVTNMDFIISKVVMEFQNLHISEHTALIECLSEQRNPSFSFEPEEDDEVEGEEIDEQLRSV